MPTQGSPTRSVAVFIRTELFKCSRMLIVYVLLFLERGSSARKYVGEGIFNFDSVGYTVTGGGVVVTAKQEGRAPSQDLQVHTHSRHQVYTLAHSGAGP